MNSKKAHELNRKYSGAIACVEVRNSEGDLHSGSAFHVGEGVFVTARHVVENQQVVAVHLPGYISVPLSRVIPEITQEQIARYKKLVGQEPSWRVSPGTVRVVSGPFYHEDEGVDVAVFKVDLRTQEVPYLPLGSHLDDWIKDDAFVLSEAIVLGYPPVPMTLGPHLIAGRAEINAIVIPHHRRHCCFILSAMPRGGFSGGVAISEWDFVLGVIVESLVVNDLPTEFGFLTVLGVEPIYECLAQVKLLPKIQRRAWDDFWNTKTRHFGDGGRLVASVSLHDDGECLYLEVHTDREPLFLKLVSSVDLRLSPDRFKRSERSVGWFRWTARTYDEREQQCLTVCANELEREILVAGLRRLGG